MSKSKILNISLIVGLAFCLTAVFWFVLAAESNASLEKDKKKAVETPNAPKAIGAYSQAIVADDFVFVSGQIGLDPKTGNMVEGGIAEQTEQVMKNLGAVLKASNSDFDSVVKATIFLADINDFAKVNEIYGRYFKAPFPARATVQVARLPREAKVEIELAALVKK
jgi:2-iminobutanoate/2-iminopropanoate deaminase